MNGLVLLRKCEPVSLVWPKWVSQQQTPGKMKRKIHLSKLIFSTITYEQVTLKNIFCFTEIYVNLFNFIFLSKPFLYQFLSHNKRENNQAQPYKTYHQDIFSSLASQGFHNIQFEKNKSDLLQPVFSSAEEPQCTLINPHRCFLLNFLHPLSRCSQDHDRPEHRRGHLLAVRRLSSRHPSDHSSPRHLHQR